MLQVIKRLRNQAGEGVFVIGKPWQFFNRGQESLKEVESRFELLIKKNPTHPAQRGSAG